MQLSFEESIGIPAHILQLATKTVVEAALVRVENVLRFSAPNLIHHFHLHCCRLQEAGERASSVPHVLPHEAMDSKQDLTEPHLCSTLYAVCSALYASASRAEDPIDEVRVSDDETTKDNKGNQEQMHEQ